MKSLERPLGWVAGCALFLMMLLTAADVVGRKFLGASIPGSLEVTELLMMVVIFAALPLASLRSEHVIFDLVDRFLPRVLQRMQHALSHCISAALMAGSAWLVFGRALRSLEQGDQTAQLALGLGPWQVAAGVFVAFTALVHLWMALQPRQDGFEGAPEFSGGAT